MITLKMHNEYYVKNNFLIIQRKFGFRRISKLKPRPKKIFARGGWEAEGGPKQPPRPKEQRRTFSLWYKLIQSTKEAKTGVRPEEQPGTLYSPINAPQDHEMHPRGFTVSTKSRL